MLYYDNKEVVQLSNPCINYYSCIRLCARDDNIAMCTHFFIWEKLTIGHGICQHIYVHGHWVPDMYTSTNIV